MHIFSVSALNFRSYDLVELELTPGVTTFIGPNGQGKTNLIEIIDFSANLQSHRTHLNQNLIQKNKPYAQTRVGVEENNRKIWIETKIEEKKPLKIKVNSQIIKKQKEAVGLIKTTLFSPNDLYLIKGDPATRRSFLDEVIIQNNRNYYETKNQYERVLKQKNALLKSVTPRNISSSEIESTLEVWNNKLIDFGAEMYFQRNQIIKNLQPHFSKNYTTIAPNTLNTNLQYITNLKDNLDDLETIKNKFQQELSKNQQEELNRKSSLIGPHRDDLEILLNDLPAKTHSSQGESWSLALCLKLASFDLLNENFNPILILDDVFSELDQSRREFLLQKINIADQTLITAAVEVDLPTNINGKKHQILNSKILS